ncbi:predicted acyltransferase [Bacteroides sp. CAG:927]|nr:predicted acyltransferase [Bacteroides sp. CAG:927]
MTSVNNTNRNAAIEALRFFSILQIAVWHLGKYFMNAGFLGVEFFFIIAGVFQYKNATKPTAPGVIVYTVNKARKFYFEYLVAFLFLMVCLHEGIFNSFSKDWVKSILNIISELLMLQSTGGFSGPLNYPTWFFSVLVYGGAIVYAAVRYYTNISIRIIFPLLFILFTAFCFNNGNDMSLEQWGVIGGVIPYSMFRGMIEISFGVLVGYIFFNYKQFFINNLHLLDLLSFVSLVFYCIIVVKSGINASYVFIFIPIILIDALTPGSWMSKVFKGKIWIWLGNLSFSIFVLHASLVALCRHFLHVVLSIELPVVLLVYLICLIPAAYIFKCFCGWFSGIMPVKVDFSSLVNKLS